MERRELARRLVLEKAILDELQQRNEQTRKLGREQYQGGDADTIWLDDDTELGRVNRERPRLTVTVKRGPELIAWLDANAPAQVTREEVATVTDEGLLWLKEHHPEWVRFEVVDERVSDAWVNDLVAKIKKAGGKFPGTWVDPQTGEEVSGLPSFVTVDRKPGNLTVHPADEAPIFVSRLLAERLPELPQLEAGDE